MKEYLEAFQSLKKQNDYWKESGVCKESRYDEEIEIVGKALQRLESIENANPSEALECLEEIKSQSPVCHYDDGSKSYVFEKEFTTIKQALLKQQKQENFFDDMLGFNNGCMMSCFEYKGKQIVTMPLEEYDEFMKQEKALEIILKKNVDIYMLNDLGTLDAYNNWVVQRYGTYYQLTEEEFNTVKEVVGE